MGKMVRWRTFEHAFANTKLHPVVIVIARIIMKTHRWKLNNSWLAIPNGKMNEPNFDLDIWLSCFFLAQVEKRCQEKIRDVFTFIIAQGHREQHCIQKDPAIRLTHAHWTNIRKMFYTWIGRAMDSFHPFYRFNVIRLNLDILFRFLVDFIVRDSHHDIYFIFWHGKWNSYTQIISGPLTS